MQLLKQMAYPQPFNFRGEALDDRSSRKCKSSVSESSLWITKALYTPNVSPSTTMLSAWSVSCIVPVTSLTPDTIYYQRQISTYTTTPFVNLLFTCCAFNRVCIHSSVYNTISVLTTVKRSKIKMVWSYLKVLSKNILQRPVNGDTEEGVVRETRWNDNIK